MYLLASALFYVTAFTLASIVGFSAVVAVVSGLIFVLLTMPVTSPPLYSIIFWWHSPYAIPLVYMFAALFVTVHFIGRLGVAGNVLAIAVLALETFWIIVGGAKAGVIVLLGAGLLSIALVTSSGSAKSLAWKIAGGVVVLLFLAAPGPLHYIRGLYAYSATILFFADMQMMSAIDPATILHVVFPRPDLAYVWETAKIWASFQLGYPLTVLSIIGIISTIVRPPTPMARHLAVAMVAFFPFLLLFAYGMTLGSAMYPFFVVFAVVGSVATGRLLRPKFRSYLGFMAADRPDAVKPAVTDGRDRPPGFERDRAGAGHAKNAPWLALSAVGAAAHRVPRLTHSLWSRRCLQRPLSRHVDHQVAG